MNNIRIVELSKYNIPSVSENKRDAWVSYGDDNQYYDTLLKAKESPTNSALINGISDMIYGKGLYATNASRKPDEYAAMVQLFSEELMRRTSDDYYTFGQAAWQIIYDKSHSKIVTVEHMPIKNLRPEKCNNEGDIEAYYYSDDWSKVKPNDKPKQIPAFGFSKQGLEVLVIKPYRTGFHYFSPVEWQSGINYAFIEIELAKFHLNNIHNRFSANMIVNFNNGIPNDEQQVIIENKIKQKFTGSEGETLIVSFNDNKESAADIQTPQLNDAHNQYQHIAEEAARKLMVSHRVTSPLLFGLPHNGGLGSNADEIKMASQLFDNTVIKPIQRVIVEHVNKVLSVNGVSLDVYMLTSQPLEFTEVKNEEIDDQTIQQQTGVEMSKHYCCSAHNDGVDEIADDLIALGEDVSDEWQLIDEQEVDYTEKEQSLFSKVWNFVSTGTARPNSKSEQDAVIDGVQYKTRYFYAPDTVSPNSREFCRKMVSAGKLYRKEDIIAMDDKVVNPGWGARGADKYSIWKFKGGGGCHHKWMRRIYRKVGAEGSIDVNSPNAQTISTNASEKEGYRVRNPKEVAMKPKDMPNEGFLKPRG